jgi:hypothetical protein
MQAVAELAEEHLPLHLRVDRAAVVQVVLG